ncbi:MAG: thioesterase family protein [Cyclobacteriaceae bacterium]|nr:thioesterase family protein [Cyclobacteriaceae bacterium]
MARIHIDLPEKFIFSIDLPVRVSDLNYGNHVGNDSILTLMQEARALFYRSLGFKNEIELDGPIGQVVADAAIVYKSESFFGDELCIEIGLGEFHKYGFDLFYKITNNTTGKETARGKTGIICFDYEKRKMAMVPEVLQKKLDAL